MSSKTTRIPDWFSRERLGDRAARTKQMLSEGWHGTKSVYKGEYLAYIGVVVLTVFTFLAIFGPTIAPYDPNVTQYGADGSINRLQTPGWEHPLGTTNMGRDILSQVIYGARITLLVGIASAFVVLMIGVNVGILSAYYGGYIDDILMRITDLAYSLPFLPLAITVLFILGQGLHNIILVIGIIFWRESARVIRSETLTQKEKPYIESAKATGASHFRILYRHIFPNLIPLVALYAALTVALAIIMEASVSFLGFGDPTTFSWGRIIYDAYANGHMDVWYWVLPPAFAVVLVVSSVFFIGRVLEKVANPEIAQD